MGEIEVMTNAPKKASPGGKILSPFDRLKELEYENLRLKGLVAELLARNQQLRAGS